MRISPGALTEMTSRIEAVIADYLTRDDPDGVRVSLLWSLHETGSPPSPPAPPSVEGPT
jgi:hypothetical protein